MSTKKLVKQGVILLLDFDRGHCATNLCTLLCSHQSRLFSKLRSFSLQSFLAKNLKADVFT